MEGSKEASDISSIPMNVTHTFTSHSPQLDLAEQVMMDYIQPAICVFGILCNLLNLLILTRPRLKESPYTYLLGLAIADLCVLVIVFTHTLTKWLGKGVYGCQFFNAFIFVPFGNMFSNSSIWITVFLTIERWISVKFPLKAKKLCTKQLARGIMVGIASVMLIINIPRFFCKTIAQKTTNGSVEYAVESSQFEQGDVYKGINWMYIVCILFIPCLILTVLNTCLLRVVHEANKNRLELNEANENNIAVHISREQRRLTVTCASIICLFLVCVTPASISSPPVALGLFGRGRDAGEFYKSSFYRLLRIVANTLLVFNLSMNFVLYCFFNQKFYKTLQHLIRAYMYRAFKIDMASRDFQRLPRSKAALAQGTNQMPDNKWNCRVYRFSGLCDGRGCRGGANSQSSECSVVSASSALSHLISADDINRNTCLCPGRSRIFEDYL